MKKIYQLMMLALIGVAFSSCVNEPYYEEPFLGTWESVYYVEYNTTYNIRADEWHEFVFYRDGTGVFTQDDGYTTRFVWDEYSGYRIEVRHSDGVKETLYYDFENYRGRNYLIMSHYSDFRSYFRYY